MLTAYSGKSSKFFELASLVLTEIDTFEDLRKKLEQARIKFESVLFHSQGGE